MPAEADLLCEYFISSSLNGKRTNGSSNNGSNNVSETTAAAVAASSASPTTSSLNASSFTSGTQFESIDFVKYNLNPLASLKSKYKTLLSNVTTNTTSPSASPSPSTATHIAIRNGNSSSDHQSSSSSPPSTSTNTSCNNQRNQLLLELNWSKIRKIGIGLYNLGNNCYLNATIQCLAYTPPFSQWLVSRPHSPLCKLKPVKGFCSLCEVERIIFDIFNSANGCAKPNNLCCNIRSIRTK